MNKIWAQNITNLDEGIYRTIKGNADELIAIGRCIRAGFPCSKVEVTNGRYDAVIDCGKNTKLLRVQIKGTSIGSIGFIGGGRSGRQISRSVAQRTYKYTPKDCDLILGVNSNNGDCYIIPIKDIEHFGSTRSISLLKEYRENWGILKKLAKI